MEKEVTPPEGGPVGEEKQAPQQQARPEELVGEKESEVAAPSPDEQTGASTGQGPPPTPGLTLGAIVVPSDDSPIDKGKRKEEDIEMTETASDVLFLTLVGWVVGIEGTSSMGRSLAEVVRERVARELPSWGEDVLQLKDPTDPSAEPLFELNDPEEVNHWEHTEEFRQGTE